MRNEQAMLLSLLLEVNGDGYCSAPQLLGDQGTRWTPERQRGLAADPLG